MLITSSYVPTGTFHPKRYRPGGVGNWSGHLPFANDLIRSVRPELLVELGTHYGESYFGFCQAVSEQDVPCVCYAVDTWMGEAHAGYYGEEVYADIESYNRTNYGKFSYLLRMTFDAALSQFAPESIDILHIDGLHTYEAVAHDFYGWLPKVKPGGIVLLHDIKTRHGGFGVWKLWDELKSQGATFEFEHSWGLGVFQKPGLTARREGLLGVLFGESDEMKAHLRRFYELCSTELDCRRRANDRQNEHPGNFARLQVFVPGEGSYSEERSHSVDVAVGAWQRVDVDLVYGVKGPLRLDLTDRPAVIEVAGLVIRTLLDDSVLWTANGNDCCSFLVGGTAVRLGVGPIRTACWFFSFGSDPQLFLPDLSSDSFDQPLRLQVWLRIRSEFSALVPLLASEADAGSAQITDSTVESPDLVNVLKSELARTNVERDALISNRQQGEMDASHLAYDYERLKREHGDLAVEHEQLLAGYSKMRTQIFLFKTEAKQARKELEDARSELMQVRASYDTCRTERAELESHLADRNKAIQELAACRSMRITAPLRAMGRLLKSK